MIVKQLKGRSLAAVDDTHLPLIITTFRGHIDLQMAQWHQHATSAILEHRYLHQLPVVYITDSRGMHVPSATVRKYWADIMNEHETVMDAMLGNIVVMDNAIMRGSLTAIQWLTKSTRGIQYVASLEEAVAEANRCFARHGHKPVTLEANTYRVESTNRTASED